MQQTRAWQNAQQASWKNTIQVRQVPRGMHKPTGAGEWMALIARFLRANGACVGGFAGYTYVSDFVEEEDEGEEGEDETDLEEEVDIRMEKFREENPCIFDPIGCAEVET